MGDLEDPLKKLSKIEQKLKTWSGELGGFIFSDRKVLGELEALTKLELSESMREIGDFLSLSEVAFNFSKYSRSIFHLKTHLEVELEIAQRDICHFKEEQLELIWDWVKNG